ncbi:hypothetical protein YC2023_046407 [Brassica napus]
MEQQSANMAPRKKKQQFPSSSANMSEPPSEKKASLSLSSSSSMVPDWTQLPEELLHIITEKLEHCFNAVFKMALAFCAMARGALRRRLHRHVPPRRGWVP